jgi:hypothetical protein
VQVPKKRDRVINKMRQANKDLLNNNNQKGRFIMNNSALKYFKKVNREMAKAAKSEKVSKIPHLAKIEKFEAQLPELTANAATVLASLAALTTADINTVLAHATAVVRRRSVLASTGAAVEVGQQVRIVSNQNSRYIGKVGTVTSTKRIRAYVDVDGEEVYCFISDLEVIDMRPCVQDDDVAEASVDAVELDDDIVHETSDELDTATDTLDAAASDGEFLTIEEEETEEEVVNG